MKKIITYCTIAATLAILTACNNEEVTAIGNDDTAPLTTINIETRADGDYNIVDAELLLTIKDATGEEKTAYYVYENGQWTAQPDSDPIICGTGAYPAYAIAQIYRANNAPITRLKLADILATWVAPLEVTVNAGKATAKPMAMQIAGTRIKTTITGAYGEEPDDLPNFRIEAPLKTARGFAPPADPYTQHHTLIPGKDNAIWYLSRNNGYSPATIIPGTVPEGQTLFTITDPDDSPQYGANTYTVPTPQGGLTFLAGHEYHFTIALEGGSTARITGTTITSFATGETTEVIMPKLGIRTEEDLREFAAHYNDDRIAAITKWEDAPGSRIVRLLNNITMSNEPFTPIADFYHTFDGGGYTITGLHIDTNASHAGLFGIINPGATVRNLHLMDATINTTRINSGGIATSNDGTILACTVQGNITAIGIAGGIAGVNFGTIAACAFKGSVETSDFAAGIAGLNHGGTIAGCYSMANKITGFRIYGIAFTDIGPHSTIIGCHWLYNGTEAQPAEAANNDTSTITHCYPFASEDDYQAKVKVKPNLTLQMNNALARLTPPSPYSWLNVAGTMPILMPVAPTYDGFK